VFNKKLLTAVGLPTKTKNNKIPSTNSEVLSIVNYLAFENSEKID